jgi:hypothetical protein
MHEKFWHRRVLITQAWKKNVCSLHSSHYNFFSFLLYSYLYFASFSHPSGEEILDTTLRKNETGRNLDGIKCKK